MVADQHRHTAAGRGGDQLAHLVEVHTDWLLQQHRHAGGDAVQRGAHVQGVGVGNDDRLRASFVEHAPVVGEVRHPTFGGERRSLRAGIGHRAQAGFGQILEVLVVLASHDAGTDQGDTQWLGQGGFLLLLSVASGEARQCSAQLPSASCDI
ncbi:hypothetical protein D3C78_1268450 [compost metagenome]